MPLVAGAVRSTRSRTTRGRDCCVKIRAKACRRAAGRGGQGPYHQQGIGRQSSQPRPDQMPQPTPYRVADDRITHGLRDDEPGARGSRHRNAGIAGLPGRRDQQMDHKRASAGPPASAYGSGEVGTVPYALFGGQHGCYISATPAQAVRPTGGRGPWRDGWRGWPGRHAYASAAGSRGSSRGGGCSAGRCACSRQSLRQGVAPAVTGVMWLDLAAAVPQHGSSWSDPASARRCRGDSRTR